MPSRVAAVRKFSGRIVADVGRGLKGERVVAVVADEAALSWVAVGEVCLDHDPGEEGELAGVGGAAGCEIADEVEGAILHPGRGPGLR